MHNMPEPSSTTYTNRESVPDRREALGTHVASLDTPFDIGRSDCHPCYQVQAQCNGRQAIRRLANI